MHQGDGVPGTHALLASLCQLHPHPLEVLELAVFAVLLLLLAELAEREEVGVDGFGRVLLLVVVAVVVVVVAEAQLGLGGMLRVFGFAELGDLEAEEEVEDVADLIAPVHEELVEDVGGEVVVEGFLELGGEDGVVLVEHGEHLGREGSTTWTRREWLDSRMARMPV